MTLRCPLCALENAEPFHQDRQRRYLRCTRCALVFVDPSAYLSRESELAYYRQHENSIDDPGYRRFLSRLAQPLLYHLAAPSQGLDFGCGPAPVLAAILEEGGHTVALYDSFFCAAPDVLGRAYDFVTASEVVEHLHSPGRVLESLWESLASDGCLAVMTKLVIDAQAFASWHYIRDPTHVCFFSRETWQWWAGEHRAAVSFHGADVVLLHRS